MSSVASNDVRPRLWRSRWAAIGAAVAVTFGGGGLFAVSAASPESSTVAIDPVRILDTRTDVGLVGPFTSPVPQDLKVTGSIPTATGTKIVVPAGATGVFLNLTPVSSTAAGFISVRPATATGLPTTSNVNFTVGAINPNAVLVELPVGGGDDGKIEITFDAFGTAGPTTEVLVDVVGYTTDTRLKAIETSLATKANSADVYTKTEANAGFVAHGEIVMSHGTSQLTATGGSTATISDFVTGNIIDSAGNVHVSLVGPMRMSGVNYGLKSVEYCIRDAGATTFINSVTVYGMQPVSVVASDPTDRSASGCYTVTVNHSTSEAYDFLLAVSGVNGIRVTGIRSTWAPASTLPAPLASEEVGDPEATG